MAVRASSMVLPSQRSSLVLSPSLALVTAAHRSSQQPILLYIVDRWERGRIAERNGEPR